MTYRQALNQGTEKLKLNNIADAALDAWYLMSFVTGLSKARFFLEEINEISEEELDKYLELIKKRASHIPLQHITLEQEFMGLNFKVSDKVLIPRQDTETLVEEALKLVKENDSVLDVCTGSGCIILSIMALSKKVKGTGLDISKDALAVAKENGKAIAPGCLFLESDLFSAVTEKYNLIVSNPPYIKSADIEELEPEVKDHEPRLALDGTEDGLFFYRRLAKEAKEYLLKGGYMLCEIGYDQGADVKALFEEEGFLDVEIIKDLCLNDRVVKGHL